MEFIREWLKEKSGELIGQLTEGVALDLDVAERFLPVCGIRDAGRGEGESKQP